MTKLILKLAIVAVLFGALSSIVISQAFATTKPLEFPNQNNLYNSSSSVSSGGAQRQD